jgi:hypothetical protein
MTKIMKKRNKEICESRMKKTKKNKLLQDVTREILSTALAQLVNYERHGCVRVRGTGAPDAPRLD